ncbi:tumor necrosis factor receptor superfamily member 12A-like [Cetorhinus maximus]
MGCPPGYVWNLDLDKCLDCGICNIFPLTPSCNLCSSVKARPGAADKTSEPLTLRNLLLTILGVTGALVILCIALGIILRKSRRKTTFSKPIEETGDSLSPGSLLL